MSSGRPTLGDVAELAGVHKATASRALNPATAARVHPETARRVREAAAELGYRPNMVARGLKKGTIASVGLIIADITNPLYPPLVAATEHRLAQAGYFQLVATTNVDPETERAALENLLSRQVDGIMAAVSTAGRAECAVHAANGVPIVVIDEAGPEPNMATIETDIAAGINALVGLLADLGHRRFGHVGGPSSWEDPLRRVGVLRAAMTKHGLSTDFPIAEARTFAIDAGRAATLELLRHHPEITAVVAYNDLLAVGALHAVAELGLRCPDDVSVVGYNDFPLVGELTPALTTVHNDTRALGAAAVEMLLAGLPPHTLSGHRDIPVRLVPRGSHGPARS